MDEIASVAPAIEPAVSPVAQGHSRRTAVIVVVLGVLVIVAAPLLAVARSGHDGPLHGVPKAVQVHYQAAFDNQDVFDDVPCYCGCEEFLAHRHLADCFVARDGTTWEPHASGCGVCIDEAVMVERMLADGATPSQIAAAVIAKYEPDKGGAR